MDGLTCSIYSGGEDLAAIACSVSRKTQGRNSPVYLVVELIPGVHSQALLARNNVRIPPGAVVRIDVFIAVSRLLECVRRALA